MGGVQVDCSLNALELDRPDLGEGGAGQWDDDAGKRHCKARGGSIPPVMLAVYERSLSSISQAWSSAW
jgi:hypothetical protein